MPTVVPRFTPATDVTVNATAAVTGGRLAGISATAAADRKIQAAHAAAAGPAFGVFATDQAAGGDVLVYRAGVVPVEAGAAITAGQRVEAAAGGTVIPLATGVAVGLATTTVAAGALCDVALLVG